MIGGSDYSLNLKFESNDGEKIFGMGQYQQSYMDLKGCVLELAQRNSEASGSPTSSPVISTTGFPFSKASVSAQLLPVNFENIVARTDRPGGERGGDKGF